MSNRKLRQPLQNKAAKVPVVMQLERLECGAACLAMVLAYFGKWVPLEQVRADCGVSRDGSNMKNLYYAAQHYGLETEAYRMDPESLKTRATYPCILYWNHNHFVVLNGFKGNRAVINDPAQGTVRVSMEEVSRCFSGILLTFAPGKDFKPSGKRKSTVEFARKRLKVATAAVVFVILTTVISSLFGIINPVMSRVFYDRLLSGKAPDWLYPFLTALIVLSGIQLLVEWANTVYTLKLNGKMSIEGNASYMEKVLRLPMTFFSQRSAGDLINRKETNASIAETLVNTVAPLALKTIMMLFYLFVMLRYNVMMTLVGISCMTISMFVARSLSKRRVNVTRVQKRDASRLSSATLTGISMAETIKATGAEAGYFRKWSGFQAAVNADKVRLEVLNDTIGMIPQLLSSVSTYIVLFMGVILAMRGEFTLGMITTFQGLLFSFMSPAETLISAGQTIQEMRTDMERVEDVMEYPDDQALYYGAGTGEEACAKLKGEVELKHVTFGYSRLGKANVSDFSMHLKPGGRIAIVGASGCGKSTVSKLITGLYEPWEGEILFDGKPIREIPRAVFTGSVAMVDQEIVLFDDTVANNIRMWDHTITDYEMILAARDAQIHDDIFKRPGGYEGRLAENGKNLSGGQRQCLEIARVLAQDPSVVILDEATSALDAKTEYDVVNAVRARGISCIIVAHRLSTIRDCDEIIVLDHGRVVERGTHDELYARGGTYTGLVAAE